MPYRIAALQSAVAFGDEWHPRDEAIETMTLVAIVPAVTVTIAGSLDTTTRR